MRAKSISFAVSDCYSSGERASMHAWQNLRAKLLRPVLDILTRCRVTADGISLLSLLCGLAFYPLFFWSVPWAFGALCLHIALDGLDGPLARHQGKASRAGSFTDSMVDQLVVTIVTVATMKAGWVGLEAGIAYIITYGIVVAFAMVRNALAVPYSWVLRPRFLVYAWLPIEAYLWPGTLGPVLWLCVLVLGMKVITGFARIRHSLL